MLMLCIYRSPKKLCGEYQLSLENELSHICNWASLQNNSVIVLGDLNLNRLRPETPEGKLSCDLEIEQSLECLITKPTRIETCATKTTRTLIDVLLTNRPELFQCCGNYDPSLSDHALIYGILKEKVNLNKPKIKNFRTYKNFQNEEFKKHLAVALGTLGLFLTRLTTRGRLFEAWFALTVG